MKKRNTQKAKRPRNRKRKPPKSFSDTPPEFDRAVDKLLEAPPAPIKK